MSKRRFRVIRGGSYFIDGSTYLRTTNRDRDEPECRYGSLGCRVVIKRRET